MIEFLFTENLAARPVAIQLPVFIASYIVFLHTNTVMRPIRIALEDKLKNQKFKHFYFARS